MQTTHLQYMIEIERTRSITQAAENLFLSQPNLSRILHDMETQLGFSIFERTSKGVRPTERGTVFLQHAKTILRETDAIESLGPRRLAANRFRICMPRSASILDMTAEYLSMLPQDQSLDALVRECHVRRALELMGSGDADIAIIRFRAQYQDYFSGQAAERHLKFELLNRYRYQLVMRREHPLAERANLRLEDIVSYTEIVHGDTFRLHEASGCKPWRQVYSVDRMAQLSLLKAIPNAYMWTTSMTPEELERWGLVQRRVENNAIVYQNALVYDSGYNLSAIEKGYIEFVRQCLGVSAEP